MASNFDAFLKPDAILNFLFDHIKFADAHARVKWEPHTVVLYDNNYRTRAAHLWSTKLELESNPRPVPNPLSESLTLESLVNPSWPSHHSAARTEN